MEKHKVGTMGKLKTKIIFWLFYCLFLLVNVLIFIGEWTQKIIIYPFLYSYKGFKKIIEIVKNIKKEEPITSTYQPNAPQAPDAVHTIKINYDQAEKEQINSSFRFPKLSLKFPEFRLFTRAYTRVSTKIQNFFSSIKFRTTFYKPLIPVLKATIIFTRNWLGSALQITFKGIYKVIKAFCLLIIRIPLYLFYFLKELAYFIYSIVRGIVSGVVAFYKYIFSPYFRSFLYGFIFCGIVIIAYQAYLFVSDLPSPTVIGKVNFAQSTHLFDRNGKLLYEIYRDVNRTSIHLKDLPDYVVNATIAIEDKNFYRHKGISFIGGILRAARDTLKTNELQGGSTITQQLVKSALLSPERTVERKLKEIALAIWTEQIYSKDEILEMYLNQVPYGGSAYGIEEASKVYLGKNAKDLTLPEAALLAGLPQAPSFYSPFVNPKLALQRRNDVLISMYELGYISKKEKNDAVLSKVNILTPETNIRAPHFVFYTRSELEREFGMKQVEEGGFRVTTTLDLEIQNAAQQILSEELARVRHLNIGNGGILVLNPQTGEILAMVGSVDYFIDKYGAFNVTTALRQPGSALKPMLYAMALERGYTASTPIDDAPIIFNNPGTTPYKPVNYDGKYHGKVTVRYALANSYNIPAVKTLNVMGVPEYIDFAKNMGIDTWRDPSRFGLALSLGGGETTLLDLAQVFSVFASGGYRIEPVPFRKIVDSKERPVTFSTSKTKVLDPGIAFIISDILSDNNARKQAFGSGSALEIPGFKVAVKTGTTDNKKDNLTIGYTPEFLVAVWVGNNDNSPMNPYLTSGVTGAAPIWNKMMKYLLTNKSEGVTPIEKPENIIAAPCGGRIEYFLVGTEKNGYCFDTIIKPKEENKKEARNMEESEDNGN